MTNDQGKKYDLIATGFANMRDSFYREKKYIDLFMGKLPPKSHILDIGCSSGYPIASYLLENNINVTGIDSSAELLKIAKAKYPTMNQIYGDIRTVQVNQKFDGIIEWWCLFHLPKKDHEKMIARFASWLKKDGILEFTTGGNEYAETSNLMLDTELAFFSLDSATYKKYLKQYGFKLLLCENDQEQHLVWIAQYVGLEK